jgi:hypothetical protein
MDGAFNLKLEDVTDLINTSTEKLNKEMLCIKNEMENMKIKMDALEKSNALLVREKNIMLVKEFSKKLKSLIEEDEFDKFKEIIETHDYPIDEYFNLENESHNEFSNNLNLLHYSIESDRIRFATFLIERGADVNIPDKIVKYLLKRMPQYFSV